MKLQIYKILCIPFFSCLLFYSCQSSRSLNYQKIENENCYEKVVYFFEPLSKDSSRLLNTGDSSRIIFYLFNGFQDTVAVSYNRINLLVGSVFEDFNITSSKYSGVHFEVEVDPNVKLIKMKLLRQQKCVNIELYSKYPICTISRENDVWIVNYRIKKIVLK